MLNKIIRSEKYLFTPDKNFRKQLKNILGFLPRNFELYQLAFVHKSASHVVFNNVKVNNERLEFLGDAAVNLAISAALYKRHPTDDEGVLSARRAAIVSTAGLARLAGRIDLGAHLRLGEGEAHRSGRRRPSLLASSFEAVVGALYLDLGWEPTRDWIIGLADPDIVLETAPLALKSPKSRLQEHTQRTTGGRPAYRVLEASGPDHEKEFRVEVAVDGAVLGSGAGPSRRAAETAAAAEALEALRQGANESAARPARHDDGEPA